MTAHRPSITDHDAGSADSIQDRHAPRSPPGQHHFFRGLLGREHGSEARARAVYGGAPGHPVVLGSAYFAALSGLSGDLGAREVLKKIGAYPIECGHLCSAADVDTPEALEQLRRRSS